MGLAFPPVAPGNKEEWIQLNTSKFWGPHFALAVQGMKIKENGFCSRILILSTT